MSSSESPSTSVDLLNSISNKMGYGAYLSFRNNSSKNIVTKIASQDCMYDRGQEFANLSYFDNLSISSKCAAPLSGGQFIESKASGSCAETRSAFGISIAGLNEEVFTIDFHEQDRNYRVAGQPKNVDVAIQNLKEQAMIEVTLFDPV